MRIFRKLAQMLDVNLSGVSDGDALVYDQATGKWIPGAGGGGGGAPTTVDYLVGTASGSLSAEIVVGTAPGGELGGTWASPTVDATHSGSSHASVQAAAEATAAAALSAHSADTTGVHGIADTSALETTAGAQAKVDAHVNDATDAHDASAISILDTANDFTATDVEGALAELQADAEADAQALADHLADTSAAHAASAISADSTTLVGTGTDVQAVLEELDNGIADHLADTSDAHDASAISVADAGGYFTGTDVEAALQELGAGGGGGGTFDPDVHMPRLVEWWGLDDAGNNYVARTGWATSHADYDANVRMGVANHQALGSGTGGQQYGANAQNDSIEWDIPLSAGTWTLSICFVKYLDCGIVTVSFDGSSVGTIDTYNASAVYNSSGSITGITVAATALVRVKFAMSTKNASSSGYLFRGITGIPIRLRRTA